MMGQLAPIDPARSRHRLGTKLRELRETQLLRLEDAALKIGVVASTLSRIENGMAPAKNQYLEGLLDLYGVDEPAERQRLLDLAVQGQCAGWWTRYGNLIPTESRTYLGLESAASQLRAYALHAIPGLLQIPSYTIAVLKATRPDLNTREVSSLVALERHRRGQLRSSASSLEFVLDESVLLRAIGSARVMADQLDHLLAVTKEASVTVRVAKLTLPCSVLSPAFTLLSFPDPADPDVACINSVSGQVTMVRNRADISALRASFEALTKSALSPANSGQLIEKLAEQARIRA